MNLAEEIKQTFIEESEELLSSLEDLLLDLEDDPRDKEKLDAVFRVMHTVKGSAGMVGESKIESFAHLVEDMFDKIRKGNVDFDHTIAGISLESRDILLGMLRGTDEGMDERIRAIEEKLGQSRGLESETADPAEISPDKIKTKSWRITFTPSENTIARGGNPLLILRELADMGDFSCECNWEKLPTLKNLTVDVSYFSWEAILTSVMSEDEIRDVFLFVESDSIVSISEILDDSQKLGEILIDRGVVSADILTDALGSQKKIGEVLVEKSIVSPEAVKTALLEQEHIKKIQQKQQPAQNIRVSTEKLDNMVNLVGELVTTQAQLAQISYNHSDMKLSYINESLQRLVEELRDTALGIRMMPVGNTFGRFRRLVRDLSRELGKEIRLETIGEDTELDKTVIDKLNDPLVHLIRNSVDHGIEMPNIREASGKKSAGTIKLEARHSGGQVQIIIEDDGGGIDKEAVRKKAINQGILAPEAELSDEEIYSLIFKNGFSTASIVSNVSGRGVGMDVVKKEIENLQGTVAIQSREGEFSRVTVSLPLTLAIIDGLMIRIEADEYILPLGVVEACMDYNNLELGEEGRRNIISYRDQFIPFISLRKFLKYKDSMGSENQIVVIQGENGRYGLLVDEVVGDHQTVIKNLGKVFKGAREFSGATIMGDGHIALILNVGALPSLGMD